MSAESSLKQSPQHFFAELVFAQAGIEVTETQVYEVASIIRAGLQSLQESDEYVLAEQPSTVLDQYLSETAAQIRSGYLLEYVKYRQEVLRRSGLLPGPIETSSVAQHRVDSGSSSQYLKTVE